MIVAITTDNAPSRSRKRPARRAAAPLGSAMAPIAAHSRRWLGVASSVLLVFAAVVFAGAGARLWWFQGRDHAPIAAGRQEAPIAAWYVADAWCGSCHRKEFEFWRTSHLPNDGGLHYFLGAGAPQRIPTTQRS